MERMRTVSEKEKEIEEVIDEILKEQEETEEKVPEEKETSSTVNESEKETEEAPEEAPETDADSKTETTKETEKEGKKFFQKKSKDEKKTDALHEKIAELEDRNRRQLAEFENYRKRTEKEKELMFETGAKSIIEKILPVVDNFERGLAAIPEEEKESAFASGMEMIYKQLTTEFENIGVKAIETIGKPFDPNLHNAVMQTESDELESGMIAQELQKGYTYRDSVVRHSMVSVVQ